MAAYVLAAFSWLTYSSIMNSRKMFKYEKDLLWLTTYTVNEQIQQKMAAHEIVDSATFAQYMEKEHPMYRAGYTEASTSIEEYALYPTPEAEAFIKKQQTRKEIMYLSEGIVFVLLLLWGLVWIYRSFQQKMELNSQQHNFLLSITHELKTPLASVKLYLQTLQKHSLDKNKTEEIIQNSLKETDRLNDLIENVLVAAQIEGKKYHYHFEEINFSDMLNEQCDKFNNAYSGKATLIKTIEPNVMLKADRFVLSIAISNLIENAFKYANKEHCEVKVKLISELGKPVLQVEDNGQGIEVKEQQKIFDKFYRVGNESTRKTKGTGLGLYIVKQVLDNHQAQINVHSAGGKGSLFTIKFSNHG